MKLTKVEYMENRCESRGWHPTQQGLVNGIKLILLIAGLIVIRYILLMD